MSEHLEGIIIENSPIEVVKIILQFPDGRYLLQERSEDQEDANKIDIIGGALEGVDWYDENIRQTPQQARIRGLLRETSEEVRIKSLGQPLQIHDYVQLGHPVHYPLNIFPNRLGKDKQRTYFWGPINLPINDLEAIEGTRVFDCPIKELNRHHLRHNLSEIFQKLIGGAFDGVDPRIPLYNGR